MPFPVSHSIAIACFEISFMAFQNRRCPSRKDVHIEYNERFIRIMRDIEAPNHLLNLFEAGIEVALQQGDTHSGEDWNGNPNGSTIDSTISELLFDEAIP